MLEIKEKIELLTNDETKILSLAIRYLVQHNYTFDMTVKSGSFAGTSHFCVRKDQISDFISDINNLTTTSQKPRLDDNDSDGFIELALLDNLGHISISAQIGGTHEDNYVRIKFETDQTCLLKFITGLQSLLKYEDSEDSKVIHRGS